MTSFHKTAFTFCPQQLSLSYHNTDCQCDSVSHSLVYIMSIVYRAHTHKYFPIGMCVKNQTLKNSVKSLIDYEIFPKTREILKCNLVSYLLSDFHHFCTFLFGIFFSLSFQIHFCFDFSLTH